MPDGEIQSQFVDEIIERTLHALTEFPEFDDDTLAQLRQLADSSALADSAKVVESLCSGEGT